MYFASITPSGEPCDNPLIPWQSIQLANKFREDNPEKLTIPNFTSSPPAEGVRGLTPPPQGEAGGSVLCPGFQELALTTVQVLRVHSPTQGDATSQWANPRKKGMTCMQHATQCRVTTGRCAITQTKIPRGNQHGTY